MSKILKNTCDAIDFADDETKLGFELSNILVDIACEIIMYRAKHNLTKEQLAKKLNVTSNILTEIESGDYNPSIGFLLSVSKKLDLPFKLNFGLGDYN